MPAKLLTSGNGKFWLVELNTRADRCLRWLVQMSELNASTTVCRAIILYAEVYRILRKGGSIYYNERPSGEYHKLVFSDGPSSEEGLKDMLSTPAGKRIGIIERLKRLF